MPQVSKRILSKEVEEKMFETLWEALSQLRRREDIQLFLDDFLTPVERIMLAKRLAIAVLLLKGANYEGIRDFLKVSNDPISRVQLAIKHKKGYRVAIDKLIRTEAGREFWRDIASLIHRLGVTSDTFVDEKLVRRKLGIKKKTLI